MVVSTDVSIKKIVALGKHVAKDAAQRIDPDAYARLPAGAIFAQQGDVYLAKLATVPTDARRIDAHRQLVPGVSMGSRHCLDSLAGVSMFLLAHPGPLDGPILLLTETRTIVHPKHGDIVGIPSGAIVHVQYQRMYADTVRRVLD